MSVSEPDLYLGQFPWIARFRAFASVNPQKMAQWRVLGLSTGIILFALCGSTNHETVSFFGFVLPPLCAFRALLGLDCPGCGITRSLIYAFHGRFYDSYMMHIWGIPLAVILVAQIPYRLSRLFFAMPDWKLSPVMNRWINFSIALSVLLPWIVKLSFLTPILFF